MKQAEEAALRRQLHAEIDVADPGPAPVEAVFRRSRALKVRRMVAAAAGVAVIAAAAGVVATAGQHAPSVPARGGGVFASGVASGKPWQLAAVNLANPGYRCLPGVLLDGRTGDLLQRGFMPGFGLGSIAFLALNSGRPGVGFAFLQLRPGVRDVRAILGDGTRLRLHPVTVTLCDQRFRLAGFEYPRQGVKRMVARSADGRTLRYAPMADYFDPASPFQTGTWINVEAATGDAASGEIGSGRVRGMPWHMRVTLGPAGECYTSSTGPASQRGSASVCGPVGPVPVRPSLIVLPYATPTSVLFWYAGTVSAQTAQARAQLSDGRTITVIPVVVGGRTYIALGTRDQVRLTRLVLYDSQRRVLATVTSFPKIP